MSEENKLEKEWEEFQSLIAASSKDEPQIEW